MIRHKRSKRSVPTVSDGVTESSRTVGGDGAPLLPVVSRVLEPERFSYEIRSPSFALQPHDKATLRSRCSAVASWEWKGLFTGSLKSTGSFRNLLKLTSGEHDPKSSIRRCYVNNHYNTRAVEEDFGRRSQCEHPRTSPRRPSRSNGEVRKAPFKAWIEILEINHLARKGGRSETIHEACSTTYRRRELQSLSSLVHENSVEVSRLHGADLNGLLSPAHDLVGVDHSSISMPSVLGRTTMACGVT
ncbi:hypothetical protein EYF80_048628 [Liparis tanakae]|uniref:Uncharacterized protein n=1 Tax=Liparis tanakae TaxID=230148 RepID=A0A4Z2FJV8_9TELE|nr:hypothetical protein EYF80_048628 [Liparis tanakae]